MTTHRDHPGVATWRYDPTKTFYLGIAMGLIPSLLILLLVLLAL